MLGWPIRAAIDRDARACGQGGQIVSDDASTVPANGVRMKRGLSPALHVIAAGLLLGTCLTPLAASAAQAGPAAAAPRWVPPSAARVVTAATDLAVAPVAPEASAAAARAAKP